MSAISLREYVLKIENLIENNDIEHAIAHCKHLLKMYPKQIDCYRLLGNAFLEKQKFGDASDIFQRVLSSVPDDFISHIGMSIIREDENNLDAAIWHMERAFEVQPSNKAVQDELRRLYTNRDGVAPPKIRLTRGALVRMYVRGELYDQAIGEINSALEEDPNRIDLEVILAKIYFNLGQKAEATEICSKIITKLPYCFEANKILTEILPGTSREEDEKIFRQRVTDLDPYYEFTTDEFRDSSDITDSKIMVDYLDWDPLSDVYDQPDWAKSIGLSVEDDNSLENEISFWINSEEDSDQPNDANNFQNQQTEIEYEKEGVDSNQLDGTEENIELFLEKESDEKSTELKQDEDIETFFDEPPEENEIITEEKIPNDNGLTLPIEESDSTGDLPEWLKNAGWKKSDGNDEEIQKGYSIPPLSSEKSDTENEIGEIEPGDIPDWIKDIAPSDDIQNEEKIDDDSGEAEYQNIDELISKFESSEKLDLADETIKGWENEFEKETEESNLNNQVSTSPFLVSEESENSVEEKDDEEESLDWLQSLSDDDFDEEIKESDEIKADGFDKSSISNLETKDTIESAFEKEDDDWLNNILSKQTEPPSEKDDLDGLPFDQTDEDMPEWIQSVISDESERNGKIEESLKVSQEKMSDYDQNIKEKLPEPDDEFTISFDESDGISKEPEFTEEEKLSEKDLKISENDFEIEERSALESLAKLEEESTTRNGDIDSLRKDYEFTEIDDEGEEEITDTNDAKENIESTIAWMEGIIANQTIKPEETSESESELKETLEDRSELETEISGSKVSASEEVDTTPSWLKELEIESERFTVDLSAEEKTPNNEAILENAILEEDTNEILNVFSNIEDLDQSNPELFDKESFDAPEGAVQETLENENGLEELTESAQDFEEPSQAKDDFEISEEKDDDLESLEIAVEEENFVAETEEKDGLSLPSEIEPVDEEFFEKDLAEEKTDLQSVKGLDLLDSEISSSMKIENSPENESTIQEISTQENSDEIVEDLESNIGELEQSSQLAHEMDPITVNSSKLEEAKQLLDSGAIDQSLQIFDELIQNNLFVEDIITAIQNALDHHYPINIGLWKTLGDGYLKKNKMQDALNAYSKAEDLLL